MVSCCGATSRWNVSLVHADSSSSSLRASQVGWWIKCLVDELTAFLLKKQLKCLCVVDLVGYPDGVWPTNATLSALILRLLLQGEGVARDDQILQSWELGHWIEELLFMWYFIEGKIELF